MVEENNDTLTLALGTQEHIGHVRGMGARLYIHFSIPLHRIEDQSKQINKK